MATRNPEHYQVFAHVPNNPDKNGWTAAVPSDDVKKALDNDLEPAEADYWGSKLLLNSGLLFYSEEEFYPGYKDVPVWYIICDNDRTLLPALQESFIDVIKEVNTRVTVRHIDTGHSPFLKEPEATAELIDEAASDFLA